MYSTDDGGIEVTKFGCQTSYLSRYGMGNLYREAVDESVRQRTTTDLRFAIDDFDGEIVELFLQQFGEYFATMRQRLPR